MFTVFTATTSLTILSGLCLVIRKEKKSEAAEKQEVEPRAHYSPPSCPCYLQQYDQDAIFRAGVNGPSVYFQPPCMKILCLKKKKKKQALFHRDSATLKKRRKKKPPAEASHDTLATQTHKVRHSFQVYFCFRL